MSASQSAIRNPRSAILAAFAAALCWPSLIFAQTNNAQYLGDSIPTSMIPGFTYNVMVTFKNTGTTTWTNADGYKLFCTSGYNFGVWHSEAKLADNESISPGQDRTFEMSFLAPSVGTYGTTWQMVQEQKVNEQTIRVAFGDSCSKQVAVAFGPNAPGAPVIHSPPAGMSMGSNRPDVRFQGDPCDAYEVHIGSSDSPDSVDGWDSTVIPINSGPNELLASPGYLQPAATWYVYARLRNTHGWGPWSPAGNGFYAAGELINEPYLVAGGSPGLRWYHRACYNPDRNEYLITWQENYTIKYRRLDATGSNLGDEWLIADPGLSGYHRTVVAYNSARKEYLIEYSGWTSTSNEVHVRRVDAATGAPLGYPLWQYTTGIVFALDLAYCPANNSYLATWEDYTAGTIYGRILNDVGVPLTGPFRISEAQYLYCRNPSIGYNPVDDEYMVTFQGLLDAPHDFDYLGQRIRASDGIFVGGNFVISAELGGDGPGGIAYDECLHRYLVVYEGGSSSPWGQFLGVSGTLIGSRFAIGTGYYWGGMCDVSWNPVIKEYLATWAHQSSAMNFGQRISPAGALIGGPFSTNGSALGTGNWSPMSIASPLSGEYLIYWFNSYTDIHTRRYRALPVLPLDTQAPGPVTGLTLSRSRAGMTLNWTSPPEEDLTETMIRSKVGSPPSGPADGKLVIDRPNCPGTTDSFLDTAEPRGVLICYALFAHDMRPNYAPAATACGTLVGGDFNGDDDVDQDDFGRLQACFSGSGVAPSPGCEDADLDIDGDVDALDLTAFRACMNGSGRAPGC